MAARRLTAKRAVGEHPERARSRHAGARWPCSPPSQRPFRPSVAAGSALAGADHHIACRHPAARQVIDPLASSLRTPAIRRRPRRRATIDSSVADVRAGGRRSLAIGRLSRCEPSARPADDVAQIPALVARSSSSQSVSSVLPSARRRLRSVRDMVVAPRVVACRGHAPPAILHRLRWGTAPLAQATAGWRMAHPPRST